MRSRQLAYLAALDRERHFGRAAASCHVTQPTLSAGIRSLEAALGVPLVRRGRRFEGFTPEGERVLEWAHRIVAASEQMELDVAALRGELTGVLRIGAIPTATATIALLTSPFLAAHPRMRAEIRSLTSREIERGLATFALDAGVTYVPDEPPDHLRTWPLYRERYLFLAPADGVFARREAVAWAELHDVSLCLLTPDMQNRRIVDEALREAGARPRTTVQTDSISTLIGHVAQGWASVLAHPWLGAFGVPAGMRAVPLVAPEVTRVVGIVAPDQQPMAPLVRALTDLATTLDLEARLSVR